MTFSLVVPACSALVALCWPLSFFFWQYLRCGHCVVCRFRRVSDCTPRSHDTDFGRMGSTHVPKIRPGRPHIRRGGACHSKIMRRGLAGCLFVPCPHAVEHLAQGAVHSEACAGAPRFCHCTGGGTARLYKLCVNKASYAIACIVCFPSKATHAPTWQSRRG